MNTARRARVMAAAYHEVAKRNLGESDYQIVCDERNNPRHVQRSGVVVADVFLVTGPAMVSRQRIEAKPNLIERLIRQLIYPRSFIEIGVIENGDDRDPNLVE